MSSDADLRALHDRLSRMRAGLESQLTDLGRRRDDLFGQGVRANSDRVRRALAGPIHILEREASALTGSAAAIDGLLQLLAAVTYAREMGDRAGAGVLAGLDLERLLASADGRQDLLQRLEETFRATTARATQRSDSPASELALVRSVPDGDGLKLADRRRVRYLGIDAPEISTRDGPPEPFAVEARELNRQLVEGQQVRLVRDTTDADPYGRLLRYVYVGDTIVNAEIVRAGLAVAFPVPPDLAHADTLERLERDARRRRRGIWGARGC